MLTLTPSGSPVPSYPSLLLRPFLTKWYLLRLLHRHQGLGKESKLYPTIFGMLPALFRLSDSTTPSRKQHSLKVVCWDCTSLVTLDSLHSDRSLTLSLPLSTLMSVFSRRYDVLQFTSTGSRHCRSPSILHYQVPQSVAEKEFPGEHTPRSPGLSPAYSASKHLLSRSMVRRLPMSRLSLPLFFSELEMCTSSILLLPTPSMPSELDSLVDSTTNAINLCMKETLVPAPLHRRLVSFWDNQLKELKRKMNKARAQGDISTYKRLRRS